MADLLLVELFMHPTDNALDFGDGMRRTVS